MKQENYIGKVYSNLTILNFAPPKIIIRKEGKKEKINVVNCQCSCGNLWTGNLANLKRGTTKSCGCYNIENAKKRFTTHGLSLTTEYLTWKAMKRRCLNPADNCYKDYGGRGITICDRWLNSFENFFEDMGVKPSKSHSIERKNNNLGYFKENCRWATKKEQMNNTRHNKLITYKGKTQNMKQWCKELNLNYRTVKGRLNSLKWSIDRCFETKTNTGYTEAH